ncbi:uncharacterized protein LOC108114003 [Drosophila eugracilis]|uniref:uncharacterized protein LOC108114003 n=1 Tax=Drosophila eugracilis TaxID=29029 RepID=UPI0007E628DF|nr:uncharacterized protein LOC108114003 [Drosophila eugracilis]
MSRLLLQCRSTLLILRHQAAAVENENGLFSKLMEKCQSFRKEPKDVAEEEESKRS